MSYAQEIYEDRMMSFGNHATHHSRQHADSIMSIVVARAAVYAEAISRCEMEIYIKGRTEILKKNMLIRWANRLFPVDRRNPDVLMEMVTESEYEAPNNYRHVFKAMKGNHLPTRKKQEEVLRYLNLNVYSSVIYKEAIIMPVARNSHRYYQFNLEEIVETGGRKVYKIRFLPKQWSQKLVCGDLWIRDESWTIDKIDINGRMHFAQFNMVMSFSQDYRRFMLPEKADLNLRYKVLGNVVETNYHTSFHFKEVEWVDEDYEQDKWKPLDLTKYFTVELDSLPIVQDSAYWNAKRDIPLTADEKYVMASVSEQVERLDTSQIKKYLDLSEQLVSTMSFDYRSARIRYSGILNPLQLGYSARNGVTYKQQLRIDRTYANGRMFRFRPELGIVFRRKELFYKLRGEYLYRPEKKGGLSIIIANGNQTYSSEMMTQINQHLKDSVFNFDDLNLEYFKHHYVELTHQIELSNGFLFNSGLSYHRRIPSKKRAAIDPGDEVEEIIYDCYDDFVPHIGLSYTPRQFYRMEGRRKEYVYSYYPTISLEYARAIPGIGSAAANYGRIEMDIHQNLPIGLLRRFYYHVSGGSYLHAKSTYFADFSYFARRNFPESWNDRIGGVFNLLKREWFNAADSYVQAHLLYESPFALFKILDKAATKHILSERFYLSQLWTPALPCYTEVGYGFGNHLFNVAVFASFEKMKYERLGVKFAFEIR